jgi:preprotein translocase SecE subunit
MSSATKHQKNILGQIIVIPQVIAKFIKEARDELKKVKWPSREITIQYTIIVIVSSLVIGLVAGGVDYLLIRFIEKIIL